MQLQRIQHLIEHPDEVVAEDRGGLLEWSVRYPYAGVFSMLLARCSSVSGHLDEEKDILRAASAMSFRQPLFDLITRAKLVEEAKMIHAFISVEEEQGNRSTAITDAAGLSEDQAAGGGSFDPGAPLEREALISAIERTIEKDVANWEGGKEGESIDKIPESSDDLRLIGDSVSSPFASWLSQRAAEVGFGDVIGSLSSPERESQESESAEQEPAEQLPTSPEQKKGLIDRFIAENPKIGPIRETQSTQEWASESIMEDASLVTETMARVYAKQGLFEKARKAYQHLSLKYPAKSTYFALQLKKLDDARPTLGSSNE